MRLNTAVLLAAVMGFSLGALVVHFGAHGGSRTLVAVPVAPPCPSRGDSPAPVITAGAESEPVVARRPPPLRLPEAVRVQPRETFETRLLELLEHPLPQGREIGRNDREDGSMLTYEQLDDGTTINRGYSRRGELLEEGMYTLDGEGIEKSYYDSGRVKGLSWTRPDGTRVDVKLGPTGLFEGRQDTRPDGSKLVTKYDSSGSVAGHWQLSRDGKTTTLLDGKAM